MMLLTGKNPEMEKSGRVSQRKTDTLKLEENGKGCKRG